MLLEDGLARVFGNIEKKLQDRVTIRRRLLTIFLRKNMVGSLSHLLLEKIRMYL